MVLSLYICANRLGNSLPCRFILCRRTKSEERAKIFQCPEGLAMVIDIEAMDYKKIPVVGEVRFSRTRRFSKPPHAQVFIGGRVRQSAGCAFDDVLMSEQSGFFVRPVRQTSSLSSFSSVSRNLGRTPETPLLACSLTSSRKCCLSCHPLATRQLRSVLPAHRVCPRRSDLKPSNHIPTDHGQQRARARSNDAVRILPARPGADSPPGDSSGRWMELVVPWVRFGADGHRQRDEILGRDIGR